MCVHVGQDDAPAGAGPADHGPGTAIVGLSTSRRPNELDEALEQPRRRLTSPPGPSSTPRRRSRAAQATGLRYTSPTWSNGRRHLGSSTGGV